MKWVTMKLQVLVVLLLGFALADDPLTVRKPYFVDNSAVAGLKVDKEKKYWSASIGDFDRDGNIDLLLSLHNSNPAEIYWGIGNGKFRNDKENPMNLADFHGTACSDLTNDGYLECLVAKGGGNGNNPGLPLLLELGLDGNFGQHFTKSSGKARSLGRMMRGRSIKIFDMNGDGYQDVLFINARLKSKEKVIHYVYKNLGNGKFEYMENTGLETTYARWATVIDANQDGILDILFEDIGFSLWLGTGGFKFNRNRNLLPRRDYSDSNGAVEFDMNLDGLMDLFIFRGDRFGKGENDDILLLNTGSGFKDVSRENRIPRGGSTVHATAADFNLDGYTDLFLSRLDVNGEKAYDTLLLNNGLGVFELVTRHSARKRPATERANMAHAVDYDMDGRPDLLVGAVAGPWRLYRNLTPRVKNNNNWIIVRAGATYKPTPKGRFRIQAFGALVTCKCGAKRFTQRVGSPGESHSQSYMDTLTFSFGKACSSGIVFIKAQYILGRNFFIKRAPIKTTQTIGVYTWAKAAKRQAKLALQAAPNAPLPEAPLQAEAPLETEIPPAEETTAPQMQVELDTELEEPTVARKQRRW